MAKQNQQISDGEGIGGGDRMSGMSGKLSAKAGSIPWAIVPFQQSLGAKL